MQHISEPRQNMMTASPPSAEPFPQDNVRMTLEKSDLWKSFHNVGTEMVITKHGRRMFPHCNISLSGLQPYTNYVLMVELVPLDNFRYRWNKGQWDVAGKAEPQLPCRTYIHPDSPAPGSYWMKQPVSFIKIKLTNNTLDQHGHIILHSMHRYLPRFYVVQTNSLHSIHWGLVQTFSFPETSFTAVTAYQNTKIAKLKIDHNPFAKGFKGDNSRTHNKRCRTNQNHGSNTKKAKQDKDLEYESPPEFQRAKLESETAEQKLNLGVRQKETVAGLFSPWAMDQDPSQSHSLHTDLLELHEHRLDYSTEEQMVPGHASISDQPYRSLEYCRLPSPSSAVQVCEDQRGCESTVPDVATVPEQETARLGPVRDMCVPQHPMASTLPQNYRLSSVHLPMSSRTYPGHLGYSYPLHGHYSTEQVMGQWAESSTVHYSGQYLPHLPFQHRSYHPGNNVADWSWNQEQSLDNEPALSIRPECNSGQN